MRSLILGVTVNVAVAEAVSTVALMVWAPKVAAAGMRAVALKAPSASVKSVGGGKSTLKLALTGASSVSSNLNVTALSGGKPLPSMVISVPTVPEVGLMVMVGAWAKAGVVVMVRGSRVVSRMIAMAVEVWLRLGLVPAPTPLANTWVV
jgi:hypothetical protein